LNVAVEVLRFASAGRMKMPPLRIGGDHQRLKRDDIAVVLLDTRRVPSGQASA
jgi:hypothetical protein